MLYLLFVSMLVVLSDAAVTGPESTGKLIRLAKQEKSAPMAEQHRYPTPNNILDGKLEHTATDYSRNNYENAEALASNTHSEKASVGSNLVVNGKIIIVEPPNASFIAGDKVLVSLRIETNDENLFRREYIENGDGRICLSLDDSSFTCWPLGGRIFFNQVTEGLHILVAKLYINGTLNEASTSSQVTFTTILDPIIIQEAGDTIYEQFNKSAVERGRISNVEEAADRENEQVNVTFPQVQITSPAARVTYTGTVVPLQTLLPSDDQSTFEKYFRSSFICFNLDIATAFSCFPIFGSSNSTGDASNHSLVRPLLIGLSTGMHTIEAALSHPDTGDLLDASSSKTSVFFISGDSNEEAAFTVTINIRGKAHTIPVVKGGCLEAQTAVFCSMVGLKDSTACMGPVLGHLKEVASQTGYVYTPCM